MTGGVPAQLMATLPFEVVEVTARPRKVVRDIVGTAPEVLAWRAVGDRLRLATHEPERLQVALTAQLQAASAEIKLLRKARPTMEDVFIHLLTTPTGRLSPAPSSQTESEEISA